MPDFTENNRPSRTPITSIALSGLKSIHDEQSIEIRPLTLLAGANSSGKSTLMQSVLLMKQTLEASYDPGPLLLDGPNVRFTSTDQIFSRTAESHVNQLMVRIGFSQNQSAEVVFGRDAGKSLEISKCIIDRPGSPPLALSLNMTAAEVHALTGIKLDPTKDSSSSKNLELVASVVRIRCFLQNVVRTFVGAQEFGSFNNVTVERYAKAIESIIHLPGLRGNPERAYPMAAQGPQFPGTFEKYTAGVIAKWSQDGDDRLAELGRDLNTLGLTWKVEAKALDDTRVELRVGRLRQARNGAAPDLVNIADVGFGVSQTLPVLVALLAAEPGQLLYIEQPEIHLHPRAQVAMGILLAKAALRGVQVVAETHSSLLLLGVQTQVAEKIIPAERVKLHWFTRNDTDGATAITSADLDEAGRFGDWPEDFDDVSLNAQAHYLDTAEALLATSSHGSR